MRLALLLPVLFSIATPAYAEGARESRYGPTTPRQATVAAAGRYDGPMLGWANKRQATTNIPPPAAVAAPVQPAPLAPWAGYRATPALATQAPAPQRAGALAPPSSLYAAPRPSPAVARTTAPPPALAPASPPAQAAGPAKDWSSYRSSRMTAVAPVTAPPAPPPSPRQVVAADVAASGATGARFYSVGRDYGLTPDAAPPAGLDNRVLVTATEPPPEPKDAVPRHGSADWLAAGVGGDEEEDDSAARRAKTRNEGL